MLRVSFSSGRDRVHRHCWISPFRTPPGNSLLSSCLWDPFFECHFGRGPFSGSRFLLHNDILDPQDFILGTLVYENNIQHWDRNSIALLVRQ